MILTPKYAAETLLDKFGHDGEWTRGKTGLVVSLIEDLVSPDPNLDLAEFPFTGPMIRQRIFGYALYVARERGDVAKPEFDGEPQMLDSMRSSIHPAHTDDAPEEILRSFYGMLKPYKDEESDKWYSQNEKTARQILSWLFFGFLLRQQAETVFLAQEFSKTIEEDGRCLAGLA